MTHRILMTLVVVGVLATACGSVDDATATTSETTTTTVAESSVAGGESTTSTTGSPTSSDQTSTTGAVRPPSGYGRQQPSDETTSTTQPEETTTTAPGSTSSTEQATTTTTQTTTTESEPDDEVTIEIEGFSFGAPLEITAGTTVTVVNRDSVPHTWTADDGSFDSGRLSPGESFTITLTQPGEFTFYCQIHPSMTGSITVTG